MNPDLKSILNSKAINGWYLFWLVSLPMSMAMVIAMLDVDMSTGAGVLSMIAYSVRWAVPFIYLVVAASAVQCLFPGPFPRWWLRNRKYIGLCFATAMAWQGFFIFIVSNFHRDYYYEDVYLLRDEIEGTIGYIFLAAMVVTSFSFGRKLLTPMQWKLLHTSGIYFLWAYPFSVYWWSLSYYPNPRPIDYVFYWSGFLVFALRIAAWGKRRRLAGKRSEADERAPHVSRLLGGIAIVIGLFVAATGRYWQKPVTELLTAQPWSEELVLWLPFWPFEPFLSLFILALGTLLVTQAEASQRRTMRPLDSHASA